MLQKTEYNISLKLVFAKKGFKYGWKRMGVRKGQNGHSDERWSCKKVSEDKQGLLKGCLIAIWLLITIYLVKLLP